MAVNAQSIESYHDARRIHGWVNARCPHCRRRPLHAYRHQGQVAHALGSALERYRGREHYPIVRWNEASRHLRGGRKITDAMQGPRWQQVVLERSPDTDIRPDRVGLALRCYERCGASWLLTDEQIEKWYDEAIARGDSYFDLPPGTFV